MVNVHSYEDSYFRPPELQGLEEIVRFPDGEFKSKGIPNSTIWIFDKAGHDYVPEILGNDVGCGISAFLVGKAEYMAATDKICAFLNGKGILGRGNHFVDLCSPIRSSDLSLPDHNVLLVHSDGKSYDPSVPHSVEEAIAKQKNAEDFRRELGNTLAALFTDHCELLGDWTHNSVEENEKIIYRKGVVKVVPEKIHVLPVCLGSTVLFYSVENKNNLPFSSMPHATGRRGPIGKTKVSKEVASSLREMVYIPEAISDSSLRTEHPSCYNGVEKIADALGDELVIIGECRILSYVGKV